MPKRIIDILGSVGALFLLLPIMLILAGFIRWKIGPPILFVQLRPGQAGKLFKFIKFRTMSNSTDINGVLLPDIERLTKTGKFLRNTSLDEIPSFWNVLKGDMSLVGPRPLLVDYLPLYTPEESRRHEVKPGITGWAQINGRNALSWQKKFQYDVWYVDNQSILIDLKILFTTVFKVFRRESINSSNSVTMELFKGSEKNDQ